MAGMEWRTLRQRTLDGKRDKRKLGRNVTGSESLPDGLLYRRVTNASGKTIDGIWSYDESKVAKIREAYRILSRITRSRSPLSPRRSAGHMPTRYGARCRIRSGGASGSSSRWRARRNRSKCVFRWSRC
jgi:hypothetical protein